MPEKLNVAGHRDPLCSHWTQNLYFSKLSLKTLPQMWNDLEWYKMASNCLVVL